MAAVYRAVHRTLGRSAAVKVLAPSTASIRELIARLYNEARSATSIRDPGVVEIYDVGVLPDQTAYILMEFLEGESLAGRLRRQDGVAGMRALQIIRAVSRTLHVAHEHGVVHRDLKPGNIFLVPDPEMPTGERVKLLDFGIAKRDGDAAQPRLTQTGAVIGTPPYMSPEQCRGSSIDRRADIYALGCVLYELVCGRPPFTGAGAEIIAQHLYVQPDPPRNRNARIPQTLEALILWLLQKDLRHRPATAADVVAAIDDLDVATLSDVDGESRGPPSGVSTLDTVPTMTGSASAIGRDTTVRTPRRTCEYSGRVARHHHRRRIRRIA
jgi:serine/threonine-protein kinase